MTSRSAQRPYASPAMASAVAGPVALVTGDQALVAQVRSGDERAFETIFRKHIDGLLAFAKGYVGAAAIAEDLVADVFLTIWAGRATFTITDSVAAYLYAATRNRAIRRLDRDRRVQRWEADVLRGDRAPGVSTVPAAADARLHLGEIAAATARALDALPERPRTVFLLYRQHGLSYAQIGTTLGISARTVEGHMARAMAVLRHHLADFL